MPCAKLGRVPNDQDELLRELGRPMPEVHLGPETLTSIYYQRSGTNSFKLHHPVMSNGDFLVYDSSKPTAGWMPYFD
jgi:hypothetical protein